MRYTTFPDCTRRVWWLDLILEASKLLKTHLKASDLLSADQLDRLDMLHLNACYVRSGKLRMHRDTAPYQTFQRFAIISSKVIVQEEEKSQILIWSEQRTYLLVYKFRYKKNNRYMVKSAKISSKVVFQENVTNLFFFSEGSNKEEVHLTLMLMLKKLPKKGLEEVPRLFTIWLI